MGRLSEKTKRILELRKQGLCSVEIADIIGTQSRYIVFACKKYGMPFTEDETQKSIRLSQQKLFHNDDYAKDYIANRTEGRFEYISGYSGCDSKIIIRCTKCGYEFERSFISFRGEKGKTLKCPECTRRASEEIKIKRREKKEHDARIKSSEKKFAKTFPQYEIKSCPVCGSTFYARQSKKYCSTRCSLTASNAKNNDKRIKKLKSVTVDTDITLEGLYLRDGGTCWICGKQCDWDDGYTIINRLGKEQFVAGNNYPSIDHVVALAEGGLHSWDNVRLACRICNVKRYYSEMEYPSVAEKESKMT